MYSRKIVFLLIPYFFHLTLSTGYSDEYVELPIDTFRTSELLPTHTPSEWYICKTSQNRYISGEIVSDNTNYLRVKIAGSNWGYFGREIKFENAKALVIRLKSASSNKIRGYLDLWTKFNGYGIRWWPVDKVYRTLFVASDKWRDIRFNLNLFKQIKGEPNSIERVKNEIRVLAFSPIDNGTLCIEKVSLIVPKPEAIRRIKEDLGRRIDFREYDLRLLKLRGYKVDKIVKNLGRMKINISSCRDYKRLLVLSNKFNVICEVIDNFRRLYLLNCRIRAISNWIDFADDKYKRQYEKIEKEYKILKDKCESNYDFTNLSVLSKKVRNLWDNVWREICQRHNRIKWRIANGIISRNDGKKIYLCGTNDVEIFVTDKPHWSMPSSREDYARMAELGLNAVRLVITHRDLQPLKDKYNIKLIEKARQCAEWAAEFGIYCIIDLHFGHPSWAYKGPKGYESPTKKKYHTPYPFLDNLKQTHKLLAQKIGVLPNVIGQEVPCNEPSLRGSEKGYKAKDILDRTIVTLPWLIKNWNLYLKNKYYKIEHLRLAWQPDFSDKIEKGLGPNENWSNFSILPPGARGEDKWISTRIYDYLEWTVYLHTHTCEEISSAIKSVNPNMLVFQQQFLGSSQWSGEPIPLDFVTLQQISADNIDGLGAHYNLGWAPYALPATGKFWYNGELPQAGWQKSWEYIAKRKGGIFFWAYSSIPDKRENLRCLLPNGRLKPDRRFIPILANRIINHPETLPQSKVCIVYNARLAAIESPEFLELTKLLKSLKVEYDLLCSMYVRRNPEVLSKYDFVFYSIDYANAKTLQSILKHKDKQIMIYGSLYRNIYGKSAKNVADVIEKNTELKFYPIKQNRLLKTEISLEGSWKFNLDPDNIGLKNNWISSNFNDNNWCDQKVPAAWENVGHWQIARNYDGIAWYRKKIFIPTGYRNKKLVLKIGAIDDFDQTYFNGKLIGQTGKSTPNWWEAERKYFIPSNLVKYGNWNIIAIRVTDIHGYGGITSGPVKLICQEQGQANITENWRQLKRNTSFYYTVRPTIGYFRGGTIIAELENNHIPLIIVKKNIIVCFIKEFSPQNKIALPLIKSFLNINNKHINGK